MINREDMLELTRRMTPDRNFMIREAGAYYDEEGFLVNTFNIRFRNLKISDMKKNLEICKTIPFAASNDRLVEHRIMDENMGHGSMWQVLEGLLSCGLENDLLLEPYYEELAKAYCREGRAKGDFAVLLFHGTYDIPGKASDKSYLYDGENVYDFLIGAISPVDGDYEIGKPEFGFLYPAFSDRAAAINLIDIYNRNPAKAGGSLEGVLLGS
ncbi:MAG: DUF4317 family protein [Eubacterium sp.]|nr:DUF4317 family protein [Eubacterium sp.]